ncbi:TetR/AcrR family transcriptional regulator [Rhizobium rosettiformans]|uniref:TetR/AcrR family transcriptional regulator n=1 Tax=Rhizobium rosettiformans TaxID=1368430 RepID=UPI002865B5C7|nr:TetR family transcriptional regulator [Rhizobium rosettiformans]MDR7026948.1 AcrR family transcriptional regulator [Rhizobium rosettiformans]MDR7065069.1 AcrR family transcriptional regulator [Rhizobium rosettiformans]
MTSQKSSSATTGAAQQAAPVPTAKEPKRKRGIARVAKLLDAGAAVFAEQGYKAATMTEIAARAGAPIGSLYQFFPNKDVLADALVARYAEHVEAALDRTRAQVADLDGSQLADRLLDVLVAHAAERSLALSLLDARWEQPGVRPGVLRESLRRRIAEILTLWRPELAEDQAQAMSVVLFQAMKSLVQLHEEKRYPGKAEAIAHWRGWVQRYLAEI